MDDYCPELGNPGIYAIESPIHFLTRDKHMQIQRGGGGQVVRTPPPPPEKSQKNRVS